MRFGDADLADLRNHDEALARDIQRVGLFDVTGENEYQTVAGAEPVARVHRSCEVGIELRRVPLREQVHAEDLQAAVALNRVGAQVQVLLVWRQLATIAAAYILRDAAVERGVERRLERIAHQALRPVRVAGKIEVARVGDAEFAQGGEDVRRRHARLSGRHPADRARSCARACGGSASGVSAPRRSRPPLALQIGIEEIVGVALCPKPRPDLVRRQTAATDPLPQLVEQIRAILQQLLSLLRRDGLGRKRSRHKQKDPDREQRPKERAIHRCVYG
ncbi:MAG: hypothetical protein U5K74_01650 [Gemmatimonadaceae bacterium]|nr:hypothetical protein [Gemmatimonadaceae bacterium]